MENPLTQTPELEITDKESSEIDLGSRVILFNDDWHTFEEVISQIIKATKCSFIEARDKTFEVHVNGKAIVYSGVLSECLRVSGVLEEILLHTQIET
ncbi:MAG: ATP-dependent Clp protease adaptor ClpS [Ignavibacteriota bacterium]|jgi:ATP-dependent Clp protease adapter protein ClpS|nr:MAG: ATP-dependent Clp protease adaptor ClpS [Chlorobiota bacterium]MBE7477674.1 ATP-dependent Clp protease adaptor ClpS [Ignavibacteriales bacterium]MBL1123783.1 ATP-dependent Clp protease adaptor ClpS [Ignavibacteriota bacterium]MCC7094428.1 ATP-dependent Clp protease adaptor ClpS [Ignavibacteriaceae bacterium]MCE7855980.1 ATP-dependent Clp protease adaptor ClpS [Ignavibacteria bacterium CHB3]MEB2295247.1 ATP-dependent Clp protease adaptor ClpS [Ignavibacteria bacterium]